MGNKKAWTGRGRQKVISLHMDAAFFFEKAVESLDRYHYDKALKYFRRAVEFDPDNPVNHCNMAGVLSEMGNYEESNRILQNIVERIDPSMTECYFYMANNYANMENYEQAEQALIHYLEKDPHGHYIEECEEMIEWLSYELNRPITLEYIRSRAGMYEHDQARLLLEQGKFFEAVELLERFVEKHPDFLAAYNNLSLAYYYTGDLNSCYKAIQTVLQKDPGNVHALCNLAIYCLHVRDEQRLEELRGLLKRIYPFHHEHVFKLAMTLAVLGEHEAARRHFRRLLKDPDAAFDPSLYHYAAVAAYNTGRYREARWMWKQLSLCDPQSEVSRFYLNQLKQLDAEDWPAEISYHYHIPFEEYFISSQHGKGLSEEAKKDPLIRSSFFWALQYGDDDIKRQAIQTLSHMADEETESVLRNYIMKPDESADLKKLAIYALQTMGVKEPLKAVFEDREIVVCSLPLLSKLPEWRERWQAVLDKALQETENRFDMIARHDLMTLWIEFLTRTYPQVPKIYKEEGWAAALEYLTAKMYRRPVTYQELSQRYGVSETTIRKNVKRMDETCGLQEKMKAVFPQFQNKL